MKILYTTGQIRKTIQNLFSNSRGRRIAVVAFVGDSADAYLPRPKGIQLYCWPKAGGTNPNTVRDLLDRGVKVQFADSLHMKVYWTSDLGAVITSANLSTYALGAGGLKEIGVFLPVDSLDIDRVLSSIGARRVTRREMEELDKAHTRHLKLSPKLGRPPKAPRRTFAEWYAQKTRSVWKLCGYSYGEVPLSQNGKSELMAFHGKATFKDIFSTTSGQYDEADWILCFNIDKPEPRWAAWRVAHHIVKVSSRDKSYDRDNPFQVIQVNKLTSYGQPPFFINSAFREAFAAAVKTYGGVDKLNARPNAKVPRRLENLIYKSYQRLKKKRKG